MTDRQNPLVVSRHLRIDGVKILSVQAAVDTDYAGDIEIEWSTRADNVGENTVFVLGQLQTVGLRTAAFVSIMAHCHLAEDFNQELTEEVLRAVAQESSVPHVLYDIAAATTQQLIGLVQMKGALPGTTPEAKWIDYVAPSEDK